jgi:hypothetical protein
MKLLFCSKEASFSDNIYPKKRERFGIKIYKPCDETGYTYDTAVYFSLNGGEETSYRDSRLIHINDILETMMQVSRHE